MKIPQKLKNALDEGRTVFSFEYFPPKTAEGVENLFERLDRMASYQPLFCDITWGAGGSTADLTLDIAKRMQNSVCVETSMHLTCTNMPVEKLDEALDTIKEAGLQNVLALRGDPPHGQDKFTSIEGGYSCALDLVKHIRKKYGDYFGIAVAGYPEAHPDAIKNPEGATQEEYMADLVYLKEKVDAGAEIIVTQLFYDVDIFLKFVNDCREIGINVPIIPGIMPIMTYGGFKRMTGFCKTKVPQSILDALEPIKDNEEAVRAYGVHLGTEMCKKLLANGVRALHMYTLNLEKASVSILQNLGLIDTSKVSRPLPWRPATNVKREGKTTMGRAAKKLLIFSFFLSAAFAVLGFSSTLLKLHSSPPSLLSRQPQLRSSRFLLVENVTSASSPAILSARDAGDSLTEPEEQCEEIYGVLPCSKSVGGNLFLMITYGYLILVASQLISEGSEMLLQVLDPGIIGGLLLPILGAMPDTLLIAVSGLRGTKEEAQGEVLVGMGILAGSTVMILTIAWGGSLWCGRCDLLYREGVGLVAKDRTLTKPYDMKLTGVTTDEQTRLGAWIMIATVIPYLVMQVPIIVHGDLLVMGHWASLIGLILSTVGLVLYCIYQVASPWLQQKRIEEARLHYIRTIAVRDLYNLARANTFGALLNADGSVCSETLAKMFESFDSDSSGTLSKQELKALIMGLGVRQGAVPQEEELNAWLKEFDVDSDEELTKSEFVQGMSKWMHKVQRTQRPGNVSHVSVQMLRNRSGNDIFWDRHAQAAQGELESLMEAEEDEEEDEDKPPKTPAQIIKGAVLLIGAGALLVAVFADPVIDSIGGFSQAAGIPAFFVAFVACPLASNASELVSSLLFAMKKKKRTISLTYSQVYGAITMNNTLCLGVFLALVLFRGLVWEFSSEVTVIVLTTVAVGVVGGSRRTFPTWMAFAVLTLYPLSLAVVAFLDYELGWT